MDIFELLFVVCAITSSSSST